MNLRRLRTTSVLATTVLVATVVGIGASGPAGAGKASGEPIRFGYIEPFPGPSEQPTIVQGLDAYVDDWNKRGGFHGQPIEIVYEDPGNALDATAYQGAATKLIDEDHVAGFVNAGRCEYVQQILNTKRVGTFGALDTCGADSDFFFATGARAPTLPALPFAIEQGSKSFGIAYPSAFPGFEEGIIGPAQAYLDYHPEVDTKIVPVGMPFPPTAADWDAAIAKMKDANVDTVFALTQTADTPLALEEARIQGFGPADGTRWILGPNIYDPSLLTDDAYDGVHVLSNARPWENTSDKEIKKMTKVLKGKVDKRDGFAEQGYMFGATLESSLKGIKGDVNAQSVVAAWSKLHKFKLPLTDLTIDWTDLTKVGSGAAIIQAKDGTFVVADDFITIPAKEFQS